MATTTTAQHSPAEAGLLAALRTLQKFSTRATVPPEGLFAAIRSEINALPATVDRAGVYDALRRGILLLATARMLDPAWCRDRDHALTSIGEAIAEFKRVLKRVDLVEPWASGFEAEFLKITAPTTNDGTPVKTFMTMDRAIVGMAAPATGRRPRAEWKRETDQALRALGLTKIRSEQLLIVAGLTAPRRTPARRRSDR